MCCVRTYTAPPTHRPFRIASQESELELGHTVQCLACRRVFLVARDQAETPDNLFQETALPVY